MTEYIFAGAGLIEPGWEGLIASFVRGWLWPGEWPARFYDGRWLGAGLLFSLPLYGRNLTNEVAGVVDPGDLEGSCSFGAEAKAGRSVLIVDQYGRLAESDLACGWVCEVEYGGRCLAGRVFPERSSAAP